MSDKFCKLDPKTVSSALRVLASEITAPDNVPAMCLCEAALLISAQDEEIARLREALETAVCVFDEMDNLAWEDISEWRTQSGTYDAAAEHCRAALNGHAR